MFVSRRAVALGSRLISLQRRFKSANVDLETFLLAPKFTHEEQQKILDTLNTCNADELSRFKVSQGRIKNLESWRNKKGPFHTLSDILEVDGLGVNILQKLCKSIITCSDEVSSSSKTAAHPKGLKSVLSPTLSAEILYGLESAVGLHLDPVGISWAKLRKEDNTLVEWDFYDFSTLPKKMLPSDSFNLAVRVLNVIPLADVYVLEAPRSIQAAQKQIKVVPAYNQQMELMSMLIALINTSERHNPVVNDAELDDVEYVNKVFHLKFNLPARLFRTLVGFERVSTSETVEKLLGIDEQPSDKVLPCTSISVDQDLTQHYLGNAAADRDLLGQALLLIVAFMDLCVYKNPDSFSAVSAKKRRP